MTERLFLRLDGDPSHGPETTVPADTLRAFAAGPRLAGHVSQILVHRETVAGGVEVTERVLPDGTVRLVVHFGDGAPAGTSCELQGSMATGAATAPVLLRAALEHRLAQVRRPVETCAVQAAVLIAQSAGQMRTRDAARAVGLGERRLRQAFRTDVGMSPKAWGRLARLHACLCASRSVERMPSWAVLALDGGFCDQAHLASSGHSAGSRPANSYSTALRIFPRHRLQVPVPWRSMHRKKGRSA